VPLLVVQTASRDVLSIEALFRVLIVVGSWRRTVFSEEIR